MMIQVLRWGALAFGVFYGFTHQQAIFAKDRTAANQHEYDRKQKLIDEAKAKWAEKTSPKTGDGGKSTPCGRGAAEQGRLGSASKRRKLDKDCSLSTDTDTLFAQ